MGRVEQDVMYDWNNVPRRVTVASFYMDETEVSTLIIANIYFGCNEFTLPLRRNTKTAMPDTLVWREELAYNEPYISNYLRHPAYGNYPVVGVSWKQADAYAKWRTDRVNEKYWPIKELSPSTILKVVRMYSLLKHFLLECTRELKAKDL